MVIADGTPNEIKSIKENVTRVEISLEGREVDPEAYRSYGEVFLDEDRVVAYLRNKEAVWDLLEDAKEMGCSVKVSEPRLEDAFIDLVKEEEVE